MPEEAIKFGELKCKEAQKHDVEITTASSCNVVISDKLHIESRKYASAGIEFARKANEAFSNIPSNTPLSETRIYEICDTISANIPDFNKYLKYTLRTTSKGKKYQTAYYKALLACGITFNVQRERKDGNRTYVRYVKIGNNT